MLFQITLIVDLCATAITLWLAFYLLARGFLSKVTLRAVILLLALSVFFLGAYNNLFYQVTGTAALRAVMLMLGLGIWHSLTFHLAANRSQKQSYWPGIGIYVLGFVTALLLVIKRTAAFVGEQGNALYVARMAPDLPYFLYGLYLFLASAGILYNLLKDKRIGLTPQGRFFLFGSIFPAAEVGYGILAMAGTPPLPRLFQDLLIFSGVLIMGLSVIRHQTLVERRTTSIEFPLTSFTILLIAFMYAILSMRLGLPNAMIASIVAFVVITHGIYDLVREFLERQRLRQESVFWKQLRQLESVHATEDSFMAQLQEGLNLLCQALKTTSGLIAIRRGDEFLVCATRQSLPIGSSIATAIVASDDISPPQTEPLMHLAWIAPSFEGQTKIAIVGIGKPRARLEYSAGELELLEEVADQVGIVVSLSNLRPSQQNRLQQLVAESHANAAEIISIASGMIGTIETNPDPDFIKIVEDGLRNLPDYITLGQSPLAEKLALRSESHVERGKQLHRILIESIESLRPTEKRPAEPLPRVWYNHAILYDAYVENVPNREIMARLYISEGTFNRTRRNALRGLARLLIEKSKKAESS